MSKKLLIMEIRKINIRKIYPPPACPQKVQDQTMACTIQTMAKRIRKCRQKKSNKHPRQEEQDDRKIPANDSETSDAEDFDNLESESDKSSIISIYTPTDKGVRLSQKSKKPKGKRRNYAFPEVINLVESDDNDDVDSDCYYSDTS